MCVQRQFHNLLLFEFECIVNYVTYTCTHSASQPDVRISLKERRCVCVCVRACVHACMHMYVSTYYFHVALYLLTHVCLFIDVLSPFCVCTYAVYVYILFTFVPVSSPISLYTNLFYSQSLTDTKAVSSYFVHTHISLVL